MKSNVGGNKWSDYFINSLFDKKKKICINESTLEVADQTTFPNVFFFYFESAAVQFKSRLYYITNSQRIKVKKKRKKEMVGLI